jgi:hypothetical protein
MKYMASLVNGKYLVMAFVIGVVALRLVFSDE